MLTAQLGFSANASTVINSVANLGALVGGITLGHLSEFVGRRLTIMLACVVGGALIYPWAFSQGTNINAAVFFMQFCVQGAWGVIPIYLSECSPPQFRAFIVGVAYQLGNLVSSASSTIESTVGERFPLKGPNGQVVVNKYDYAKVMAILMGCVFGYVLLVIFVGPEFRHRALLTDDAVHHLEIAHMEDEKAIGQHAEKGSEENVQRIQEESQEVK